MSEEKERFSISTLLMLATTAVIPMGVATGFSNFERLRGLLLVGLASAVLLTWLVGIWRAKEVSLRSPQTLGIGLAFGGFVALSLLWSGAVLLGTLSVILWASLVILFVVAAAPVGKAPSFLDWSTAVATGVIAAGAMGVYEFFGGEALRVVWRPSGVTGGFDGLLFAAVFYAVALPVVLGAVAVSQGGRRWFLAVAAVVGGFHFALVIDGVILGVMAAGAIAALVAVQTLGKGRLPVAVAGGGLALLIALGAAGLLFVDRPDRESDSVDLPRVTVYASYDAEWAQDPLIRWPYFAADRAESPLDYRFRPYLNSVMRGLFSEEPMVGHGAGGWKQGHTGVVHDGDEVMRQNFNYYPAFESPHSDYGRVLVEQGVVGLALFILWLLGIGTCAVAAIRRLSEVEAEEGDHREAMGLWVLSAVLVIGLGLMFFTPFLELMSSAVIWVVAAGLLVARAGDAGGESRWGRAVKMSVAPVAGAVLIGAGVLLAGALMTPATIHGMSALERGHGDHLMLRTHFREAIPHYQRAQALYPAHPEVLYNVALAYEISGEVQRGRDAIQEAVEMRPTDSRFLAHAAYVELATDRLDMALHHGAEAVRHGPNYLRAYEVYAAALQRRARYGDAVTLMKAAIDRGFSEEVRTSMYARIGKIYDGMLEDPESGIIYLEKALETYPVGPEREYLVYRKEELEKRILREELEAQGLPVPPELMPAEDHHHHHHHGMEFPGEGGHGPGQFEHDHDHGHHHH